MIRFRTMNLALILILLLPLAASAQRETRQTREGSKFIGLAMTKQTHEEKADLYQQALTHLREGMAQDAQNARVWLLAGTALAGLGEMQEADRAFERALELNAGYREEVQQERFDAWVAAFQRGLQAMEGEQLDDALRHIEAAEQIHQGRPEGQLYLGILYANHQTDYRKAEQAFRKALEATRGPLFATLDEEGQAEWIEMRQSLADNIERMLMMQGVTDFQEQRYAEAAASFKTLSTENPYSRDAWFNYSQAVLAEAQRLAGTEGTPDDATKQRLVGLYNELEMVAKKTQELDPNNELTFMLLANAHRLRGELMGTAEAGSRAAYAVLEAHDAIPITVDDVNMAEQDGTMRITGVLKNRKLAAGTAVRLNFTLLQRDGSPAGQQTVTVTAPDADTETPFEVTIEPTAPAAGWKYTVGN
jgi:tetratricopeptide (TPR) repeat protein